jgi:mannose-6-phosphate isomerase-like protein (cupin superfamily)
VIIRAVASAGETLRLPGGASFTVRKSAAETGGERVELEITLPPGASGPPLHFHPRQEEQWEVLAGTLTVRIGDEWRTLPPGGSASIPAGQVHTLRNSTTEEVRVLDVHIPAFDFEDYMKDLARLHAAGKITNLRSPRSLVYLAMVLREHRTTQLTASRVQRVAESVLSGVGKLLRMRLR